MVLLVDLGNTKIKLGFLDQSGNLSSYSSEFYQKENLAEYLLSKVKELQVSKIFLSSVLNLEFNQTLAFQLKQAIPTYLISSQASYKGLDICYESPASYGVDRWLALVALYHAHKLDSFVLVTSGSAMAVDLVQQGEHQGGYILPGVYSSFASLAKCDALPELNQLTQETTPTCATTSAIQAGVSKLYKHFFEGLQADYPTTQLFLGGGDAPNLKNTLNLTAWKLEENLVLQGLALISTDKNLAQTFLI